MNILELIPKDWLEKLYPFFSKEDADAISSFLSEKYAEGDVIYPPQDKMFRALELTKFKNVKAVWIGQDPYHGPGQATGLAFAVPNGTKLPPSLKNIFKEYVSDMNVIFTPVDSSLETWAENGVLLLNSFFSVKEHEPMSHANIGWDKLTRAIIKAVSEKKETVAFILLGNDARSFKSIINIEKHVVFEAAHPSPLSAYRGFFGCRLFTRVNEMLSEKGASPIDWRID